MGLAQQCGDIQTLLRAFFGFMHRCTDFYVVDADPRRAAGFAPGAAEALVRARGGEGGRACVRARGGEGGRACVRARVRAWE